jgi:hypothetical protein
MGDMLWSIAAFTLDFTGSCMPHHPQFISDSVRVGEEDDEKLCSSLPHSLLLLLL